MIEVAPGLHVGSQLDFENLPDGHGMAIVHGCKEPHHRKALGYTGRAAPKDDPEYLFARRDDRLILNLVDVADPAYVARELIDTAVEFITEMRAGGREVLVHCNQGRSRSPTIAMLVMAKSLPADFKDAEEAFREIYPDYDPANGMREFARTNWDDYRGHGKITEDSSKEG
jgi:Dual specificity phosphatase, catalytic domain